MGRLWTVAGVSLWLGCAGDPAPRGLVHEFEAVELQPGEEIESLCESWTLDNDEPVFVSSIRAENDGALHHSNWYWVPDDIYAGPDGSWDCSRRGFDSIAAGLVGGVIFAQSTQSPVDSMTFAAGAVERVPPHARIVGDLHLLNAGAARVSTTVRVELGTVEESEVTTELGIMGVMFQALEIPAASTSEFSAECDFADLYRRELDREPDFRIYAGLAHYHGLGTGARAELIGGARDGEVVFETNALAGEEMSNHYPTPASVEGATGIRISCTYDNPRDEVVGWGFGDQEMCAIGFYTDSPLQLAASVDEAEDAGKTDAGVERITGPCRFLKIPRL